MRKGYRWRRFEWLLRDLRAGRHIGTEGGPKLEAVTMRLVHQVAHSFQFDPVRRGERRRRWPGSGPEHDQVEAQVF